MAEWSIAAVLKTVDGQLSRGSNPFLCAKKQRGTFSAALLFAKGNEEPLWFARGNAVADALPRVPF